MKNLLQIAVKKVLVLGVSLILFCPFSMYGTQNDFKPDKDCCYMNRGIMMCCIGGVVSLMDTNMTMKNGTRCMVNGECLLPNGKTIKLKEGQCCDMMGKVDNCMPQLAMRKKTKTNAMQKKINKASATATYFCPVHLDVMSGEEGHCGKCGMALAQKLPMETTDVDME